jgi:hypothetical protein
MHLPSSEVCNHQQQSAFLVLVSTVLFYDKSDGYGLSAFVVGAVAEAAGDGGSCFPVEGTYVCCWN